VGRKYNDGCNDNQELTLFAWRVEKSSRLLVVLQGVVGVATLAVLVIGVLVLRSVNHMAE